MSIELPTDAKVRFTTERLSILTPRDRQGLAGRIGVIQTDSNLVAKPTVYFPANGDKPELRLFRVDPRHLELVESPPDPVSIPSLNSETNHTNLANGTDVVQPATPVDGAKLSQSDLDNFFD
ncbi:MAG: hypothetical protein WCH60_09895 [Burkholderiales bacterium]